MLLMEKNNSDNFLYKISTIGWSVFKSGNYLLNLPITYSITFKLAGTYGSSTAIRSTWIDELCGSFDFGCSFR